MKTYMFYLLVACSLTLHAQPTIQWQNFYGAYYDAGNLRDLKQTPDGGYVIIGSTVPVVPFYGETGFGSGDIFVIRLDSARNIIWAHLYGGPGSESYRGSILAFDDGTFLFAGQTTSMGGEVTSVHGSKDIWLVKLDADGNILWDKSYGGSVDDYPAKLIQTSDGNFVFCGFTSSVDGDVVGAHGTLGDGWVVEIDPDGNILWQHPIGGTYADIATNVKEISGARLAVSAFNGGVSGEVTVNHGAQDCWIVIIDENDGTLLQEKSFGGSDYDHGYDILQVDDGYVILGDANSDDGDLTAHYGLASFNDAWIIKTDSALNLQWQKTYGGSFWEQPYEIIKTADGKYVFVASSYSKNYDVSDHHGSTSFPDIWVVEIDTGGTLLWEKSLGGNATDDGYTIEQTADGGFLIGGVAGSVNGDCIDNDYPGGAWILKLSGCNLSIHTLQPDSVIICNNQNIEIQTEDDSTYTYQWYLNGDSIPGADAWSVTTAGPGDYSVIVSDTMGCIDTSEITNVIYSALAADVSALGDLNICETDSVQLSASPSGEYNYQWFFNGDTIFSATGELYTATIPGDYFFTVTNNYACEASSEMIIVIDSCADVVTNAGIENAVTIFPNPNAGNFTYESGTSSEKYVEIWNSAGERIYEMKTSESEIHIDISAFISSGIYFIRIKTGDVYSSGYFIADK